MKVQEAFDKVNIITRLVTIKLTPDDAIRLATSLIWHAENIKKLGGGLSETIINERETSNRNE